ncbi:myosin-9 [Phlebotomus argentipes]|uniref:myosin-9 n=1 Tax=Phlebotomus argentipes TaxID=94469 RepID=UPI0028929F74|nr:myosin-9 [Phlebotomus argentipes]
MKTASGGTYIFILCSLLLFCSPTSGEEVTNADLREGIKTLTFSVGQIDVKLERHEQRERGLGELVKRAIVQLQKGQRQFEPMKGTFSRLDERVSQIESMLISREQAVTDQQNKLAEALDAVLKWMTDNANGHSRYIVGKGDMSDEDEDLGHKIDDLSDNIKSLRREIAELRSERQTADVNTKAFLEQTEKMLGSKLNLADEVMEKLEEKLVNFYVTSASTQNPLSGNNHADWEKLVTEALADIRTKVYDMNPGVGASLSKELVQDLNKETLEAIQDMKLEVLEASDKSFTKTAARIKETHDDIQSSVADVLKQLSETTTSAESFFEEFVKRQETLQADVTALSKIDKMLLQTADSVLDTKRKVELGVHQISQQVGEIVSNSVGDLNDTITKRFDALDETILDNHLGSLANLSSKIETEISQVWRQVGIMYQEISSSKAALDRLQQQTEAYVNGTVSTMDSMEGKVTLITSRMTEVDANLNYLLGRLSLVTQEFNQIKLGLGDALDNIRSSFMTVQDKIKDVGPGPHQIPPEELEEGQLNHMSY